MTHAQSSLQTRQAFAAALKQRLREQPFSQITVSALVRDCDVNRKTFYYHFTDVYDLLNWTMQQDTVSVLSQFHLIQEQRVALSFVLQYIEENRVILLNIYRSSGPDVLRHCFYDGFLYLAARIISEAEELQRQHFPEAFKEFLCKFLSEAFIGILCAALTDPALRDPERMVEYLTVTIRSAITGSLDAIGEAN